MLTYEQIKQSAAKYGLDPKIVYAVSQVESSGSGFGPDGKFPTILFEGHQFSKLTGGAYDKTNPTISYPSWTKAFYAKDQAGERARLEQAVALNRIAALQATSYGLFQIMGFNFAACGCRDVQDFVNKMCKSEQSQLDLFLRFVQSQGLIPLLKSKNWAAFAKAYNGPEYAKNSYDIKLSKAFLAAGAIDT